MSMYSTLRPLLFSLDAETSHDLTLSAMKMASNYTSVTAHLKRLYADKVPQWSVNCMGLRFANPVGLAAGLDKQALAGPAFCALGFGFIELGTVTPEPQTGNPKPRMFRLAKDRAIINRMGFNSGGVDTFLHNLRRRRPHCITGVNIGKNAATLIENALDDYRIALRAVYDDADYVTVNISSPNTRDLRTLQEVSGLSALLSGLRACRCELQDQTGRNVPIAIKIAPDLGEEQIPLIAESCVHYGMDAIIATNTTVSRPGGLAHHFAGEAGGLSGAPLSDMSTRVVAQLCQALNGALPVIAAGGIMNGDDALAKVQAGATLLQLYTGLVYRGPELVREVVEAVSNRS